MQSMTDYLIDTNVLLRSLQPDDPLYDQVRSALLSLRRRGHRLCYTSQNLAEFWNVCTRPATARGGFGLTVAETERRVRLIERRFLLLADSETVHRVWRRLLVRHKE